MASSDFNFTENPLSESSAWSTPTNGWGNIKTDGAAALAASANTDSCEVRGSTGATISEIVVKVSTDADAGPALMDDSGNGYVVSFYDGSAHCLRADAGPNYGANYTGDAVTLAIGDVVRLTRGASTLTVHVNTVLKLTTSTDTTYAANLKSGVFGYSPNTSHDSWTDGAGGGGSSIVPIVMAQYRHRRQ